MRFLYEQVKVGPQSSSSNFHNAKIISSMLRMDRLRLVVEKHHSSTKDVRHQWCGSGNDKQYLSAVQRKRHATAWNGTPHLGSVAAADSARYVILTGLRLP